MLALREYSVIGLPLLVLIHATQGDVLLTANIEDIKRLAMKFVSESLAEKIALFIVNAMEHVAKESPVVERDVSEENKGYNISQASSSREYDEVTEKKNKRLRHHYRKDAVFNQLEEGSKYMQANYGYPIKTRASKTEDIVKPSFLIDAEEVHTKKTKRGLKLTGLNSIEDNNLFDGDNKTSHIVSAKTEMSPSSEGSTTVKLNVGYKHDKVPKLKVVATSGDLMLQVTRKFNESEEHTTVWF